MQDQYSSKIAEELAIQQWQVAKTIMLLDEGSTIPFIARYRKEITGSLDETFITKIRDRLSQLRDLEKRREAILSALKEQENLTPELEKLIRAAATLSELEDLYLPYRPKRKTRATIAKAKGLEPLAKMIMSQYPMDLGQKATLFVDKHKEVNSVQEALEGARDIIAEWINENASARAKIRNLFNREGSILSKVAKDKEAEAQKYESWFQWEEKIAKAPSHRLLAMFRGEKESFLKISIEPPEEMALEILHKHFVRANNESSKQVELAIKDGYKRLLCPSMETEIRQSAKDKADKEAIRVFVENIRQLLLSPALGQKTVLAIDPGFKSGCKVVCLDKQGKLLHNETIFPHPPQRENKQAANKIINLVNAYKIEAIAIGNGTAGRETEEFIRKIRFEKEVLAVMVNESGASVYSASGVAREEFPDYDVTVRGAISIGRRLMDPLAELVKIDPKSIGVGQYQHDVDQKELQQSLEDTVLSCVNKVGVEVNTASKQLLEHVSGLGPLLSKNIVDFRNQNGPFRTREEFRKVPRFGEKAFEQSAGFLRIHQAGNPLDSSAVHPESYSIVDNMARDLGCTIADLIQNQETRKQIVLQRYITAKAGLPTLSDIMEELAKPGRDPRNKFDYFEFDKSVSSIGDIRAGMTLPGIITNITAFGAFVDIGVHQDGLVHISQIRNDFVKDPNEVLKLNQKVLVKVLDVNIERKRIQLSMRDVN